MKIKIKRKKINDGFYDATIWYVMHDNIVFCKIYQGYQGGFLKTIYDKNWDYIIQYVKGSSYKYERFSKFREAKERAKEVVSFY